MAADAGTGEPTSAFASCQAILDACHEVDTGDGPVHDCHELAHDAQSEETCSPKKTSCVSLCVAAGLDGGSLEAGPSDASGLEASASDAHGH